MRRLDERGETLVEVVMALGILSLVLVSSYALATGTFRLGRGAGDRTQAVNYLQQQAEALRTYRDKAELPAPSVDRWSVFSGQMAAYSATNPFCMALVTSLADSTKKVWQPVAATDNPACTVNGVTLTVVPTAVGAPADQYNYVFTATWKVAGKDNSVTITTKLVKQQ